MDPISQGVLGAACGQSISRPQQIACAAALGAMAGMAADVDVVINSASDPILFLEYHRHFTHSLIFIPVGALVCAVVAHVFVRRHVGFTFTFLACLAGYASHGLLDACTAYGTLLLWPFSNARIAWNNVSVIDPLFTVPLGALMLIALRRKQRKFAVLGLAWAVAYLSIGYLQMLRAADVGAALAQSRGHEPARARAMPSIGNLWLWRHIYEFEGRIYADAIRIGLGTSIFEGSSLRAPDVDVDFPWLNPNSTQAADLRRFSYFADGFLGITRSDSNRLVDLRYSALPNEVAGIWSITLDPSAPADAHVGFIADRGGEPGQAQTLLGMLFL
jgi:inner membrane protein